MASSRRTCTTWQALRHHEETQREREHPSGVLWLRATLSCVYSFVNYHHYHHHLVLHHRPASHETGRSGCCTNRTYQIGVTAGIVPLRGLFRFEHVPVFGELAVEERVCIATKSSQECAVHSVIRSFHHTSDPPGVESEGSFLVGWPVADITAICGGRVCLFDDGSALIDGWGREQIVCGVE